MIKQSFIFLERVSETKEKQLWQTGCKDWNHFLETNPTNNESHKALINKAKTAILEEDASFFANLLPSNLHWRLYNQFKESVCFLDIETTGFRGVTTVVGIYDGRDTHILIRDQTLDSKTLQELVNRYKMIITFNGACFDLPVLKKEYNVDFSKHLHIDLRGVCSKLDLRGGLKVIEPTLGIKRCDEVEGMSGYDAVILWKKYKKTGDIEHLNKLVKYNEEDIVNLETISNIVIPQLWDKVKN